MGTEDEQRIVQRCCEWRAEEKRMIATPVGPEKEDRKKRVNFKLRLVREAADIFLRKSDQS